MRILIVFFILILIAALLILRSMRIRQMEEENRLMQAYMNSIQESYASIQDKIEAVRKYRHDLAKHIQTLEGILEQADSIRYCRNEVVNSILSEKARQCANKKIPFEAQVEDEDYSGIREIDMAGILHNLLDNAIEADARIPSGAKRGVFVVMKKAADQISIEVSNQICPGEKVTFETTKEKKEEHGIGTKIIDELVEKYHGKKVSAVDVEKSQVLQKVELMV